MMFPVFVPINPTLEVNRQVSVFERLLRLAPVLDVNDDMVDRLKNMRTKEKQSSVKDYAVINTIDQFLEMR